MIKKSINKVKMIVLLIFFIFIGIVGLGMWYVSDLFNSMDKINLNKDNLGVNESLDREYKEIRNIALFGIDTVEEVGRSDSIIILTLDLIHEKIKITSIMRDSYVNIPGKGMDKINHAYAFGGPELSIRTINENFGLNIKDFIAVKMSSLKEIINKLGGVDIQLNNEEITHIKGIDNPGVHSLNGEQALAYTRIRYAEGGDAKRTERHRTVINSIFENLKYTSISEYPALIKDFLPFVQTNLSPTDILDIYTKFAKLMSNGMEQYRIPSDEDMVDKKINGVYYLDFNKDAVYEKLKNYIFNDTK